LRHHAKQWNSRQLPAACFAASSKLNSPSSLLMVVAP
jgi:hypothetical protein